MWGVSFPSAFKFILSSGFDNFNLYIAFYTSIILIGTVTISMSLPHQYLVVSVGLVCSEFSWIALHFSSFAFSSVNVVPSCGFFWRKVLVWTSFILQYLCDLVNCIHVVPFSSCLCIFSKLLYVAASISSSWFLNFFIFLSVQATALSLAFRWFSLDFSSLRWWTCILW